MEQDKTFPHLVVIGAGFAGIELVKATKNKSIKVTLIDKNNFHQFTPLLYQVATSQLEIEEIVFPIRQIVENHKNLEFKMAEVIDIDRSKKQVITNYGIVDYDFLVIGIGSTTNYFGLGRAMKETYPLKELIHGIKLRNKILELVETRTHSYDQRDEGLLEFVIVGGGPTGVEFAGALAELLKGPILSDHPHLKREHFVIHLIDGSNRVLNGFDEKLSKYTLKKLKKLGVTVHNSVYVTDVSDKRVVLSNGSELQADLVLWTAGIKGPNYLKDWGLQLDKNNFIVVDKYLQVLDDHSVFAMGDIASIDGNPLPKIATVAQQQGKFIAKNILKLVNNQDISPFEYKDKGKMAVIGRNAAVVEIKKLKFTGFLAWISWSALHIYKLIGFRNRLNIMVNWAISYIRKGGQSRIILPIPESNRLLVHN